MQLSNSFLFVEFIQGQPVEVLRVGEFTDRWGRDVSISSEDLDAFVANFQARAAGQDIPIDIQHEKGEAGGWVVGMQRQGDKLLALIDWNEMGRELVADKVYRYVSATIDLAGKVIRAISLVNFPAVKGLAPLELSEGVVTCDLQEDEVGGFIDGLIARITAVIKEALSPESPEEPGPAEEAEFVIRKEGGKYVLYSKDRKKKLGTYDSKEEALKREREIQYFKHQRQGGEGEIGDIELRRHHSAGWHRCWEKLKPKYGDRSAAAICTWSVKRAPNPPNVYAEEPEGGEPDVLVLTMDDLMGIDELSVAALEARGIAALRVNTETWDVTEIPATGGISEQENEMGELNEQQLEELKASIRSEMEAEMAEQQTQVAELRERVRAEVEAELREGFERRAELAEFAEGLCSGEHALSAKPEDVVEFLAGLEPEQAEAAKALLSAKRADLTEKGSGRDGEAGKKKLPPEIAYELDRGEIELSELSDPVLALGDLSEYDLSKWQE